ncbi:MAG: right-handed parallel beta-helix repeat-containing protein, partial [Microcystis sp. LE17-20A]|uniref:Calx-beta domain-containing protein n=1 Tax=Microcystis sp. LE17-20A TaxID=3016430 RepID=UPI0022BD63B4
MTSTLLPSFPAVYDVLFNFAQSDGFWANLETAFGTSYDVVKATQLRQQWQSRNFSQLPEIEVVNSSVLGSANGAYGISTNKTYLSESFFASASLDALVAVILEEIGHFVDAQINRVDTVGDEGELFSHLVRGVNLTEAELTYIQAEDDRAVINLGGQFIGVEQAAPITLIVNTTIDENDGSATIGSGLSLRDAVTIANKSPNTPYIIKLKSGTTYELTYVNNTTTGDRSLNTNGTITIETDGTALASIINNASPIPGQNDNNSIINNSSQLGVILNNLYISNKAGKGIYNNYLGTLTLTNNTITGNTANFYGGGIYNAGTLTLTNNTISDNTANFYGGGIYNGGTLTLTNSTITDNTATYGGGGGIYNNGGTLTLTNSTITGNTAPLGGGGIENRGTSTLTNSTISDNTANNGYGGGIFNSGGTLTLTDSTITGNTANNGYGGGIFNSGGTLTLTDSTITGNTANNGYGGGIYNNGGTSTLTNNILTNNNANVGGGIFNWGTWSSNSTISGNTANQVWYIDKNGKSTLFNTEIQDPKYPNIFDIGTYTALPPTPNSPPKPTISVSNAWVDVPAGTNQTKVLKFEVKLSSAYDKPITVDYYTLDGSANSIDPNQLKDFNNVVKRTLSFFPGQTSKQIEITVLGSAPPTDQTFEILAKDTAYRNWTDTDKGKEVDKKYDYSDLGYEGYRINKVFKDSSKGFDAFGLTSDEKFFLVLANPLNANEFTSNSNNLLQDIANTSGGNNTAAYTAGQNLINQLTSANQSYTFTDGTIYDLAKPPVLAIRGTEFSSGKDLLSDTETEGVGYNQFNNNKAAVNQWLSEVTNPLSGLTLKPNITGHSLGGALSQWVGGSYTGQLGKIVTFNSPGISQQPGINFNATNNLGVTHYITSADVVSIAGSTYLNGLWNLDKYSKLTSAITFEKHSVPVLNQTITRTNLSKPTDLTQKVANGNTTDLSDSLFTYFPDADYFALQAAVTLISPILGAALTFRGTVELNRKAIGIAIDSIGNISDAVKSAYNAAKSWTSDAWDAIIGQSKKILGLSPSTANQSNSTLKLASSFLDTNSYEIATTATASQTIDNFWSAIPNWGDNAWQATTKWSGDAWKSIDEWTPQTWQATTTWTAADWDKPFFTISNPTIVENNSGTNNLIFKVTLSTTSTQTITVNYATADNTATAGSDYTATTGTLTFTPGQISQDIIISVNGDTAIEPDETFLINLSNPSNALITDNQGLGTITNDDVTLPSITLAVSSESVTEDGTTNLVYTFTRTGATTDALTVNYTVGGTATFDTDYTQTGAASFTATTGTVTFAAGSDTATVTIDPTADTNVEDDETVTLNLAPGTGYAIGTTDAVVGIITDTDNETPSNQAPTDLALSATTVNENVAPNTVIGTFSTTDPDTGNNFTYSLIAGTGDTDNSAFSIVGNQLQINNSPDFETKNSYSIRVKTTDQGGLSFEKTLTITVNDVNE